MTKIRKLAKGTTVRLCDGTEGIVQSARKVYGEDDAWLTVWLPARHGGDARVRQSTVTVIE